MLLSNIFEIYTITVMLWDQICYRKYYNTNSNVIYLQNENILFQGIQMPVIVI